jgi:hypothetical protein
MIQDVRYIEEMSLQEYGYEKLNSKYVPPNLGGGS